MQSRGALWENLLAAFALPSTPLKAPTPQPVLFHPGGGHGDLAGYFKFNQAIHLKSVKYSGNAVLYNTYRQLNANVRRARYMANLSQERWDAAVREHGAILEALAARDVVRIKALLADHLAHKLSSVLAALQAAPARQAA